MTQTQPQSNEEPEIEVVDTPVEAIEPETPEPELQEPEFDPKERVDITDPKVQRKFNDVYKQMKMSDARNKMLADMNQKALDKISELESRFSQTDHAEAERILTSRLKEARETGDEDKADKILQEIIDFRVDSKIRGSEKKEHVKQAPVDDPDVRAVVSLAQETDVRGNLLRPWIDANHPAHANAMRQAGAIAVSVNAELGYVDIEEVFKRMDDAMKPKPVAQGNSRAADPMRGNLTNNPAKGKMKLSSQELAAAQKLGVKPEDYMKWKR